MNITARFLLALLICTMVAACNGKKDFVVSGEVVSADSLISPDKMILILSDVHIIEASMLIGRNEGKEPDGKSELYYQGIFRKYQISQRQYDLSLAYYRKNPENFAKMYDKVIEILENRQKKIPPQK
jgi:hypothetical protein